VTQRLTAVQTPESGTATYIYNADGTVFSKTDAKGQVTRYSYETYGRVAQTDAYPAGASVPDLCQEVAYTYDSATVLEAGTATNGYGRLTGMNWSSPSTATGQCQYTFAEEYAYTGWGQVFLKRMTVHNTLAGNVPPVVMEGAFRYDAEGRLSLLQTPYSAGDPVPVQTYTYDRDALGRAVDMYSGSPQQPLFLVTGVSYSGAGRMLGMTFGGGYTETRQYNANQQLTRQTAVPGAGQGMDLTYNYGTANNGRVASATDNLSGNSSTRTALGSRLLRQT
jgi:YD repeat-containing protein